MNVYIQSCHTLDDAPRTELLACMHLRDGTVNGYMFSLEECLNECKLSWSHVIGMGTDGASVMCGHWSSLTTLVSCKVPDIEKVHCVAHVL